MHHMLNVLNNLFLPLRTCLIVVNNGTKQKILLDAFNLPQNAPSVFTLNMPFELIK